MAPLVALLIGFTASGCYLSHERPVHEAFDAGPPRRLDAGAPPRVDSGPPAREGRWWSLEAAPVTFEPRCAYRAGEVAWVRVRLSPSSPCHHPGPAYARLWPSPDGVVHVWAYVWMEHDAVCAGSSEPFEREIAFLPESPGTYVLVDDVTRSRAPVEVGPPADTDGCPDHALPEGSRCEGACWCGLSHCVAALSGATCESSCAWPCAGDLDCRVGDVCIPHPSGGNVCMPRVEPGCRADADCPSGQVCARSDAGIPFCDWGHGPWRPGECTTDADCLSSDSCVLGVGGQRFCATRCLTATMRCPSGNVCAETTFAATTPWTCGALEF